MQAYSDPSRASDPHALPDVEVFYANANEYENPYFGACGGDDPDAERYLPAGWYWWACFPGCLPDGEPNGPFASEAEALADAQDA